MSIQFRNLRALFGKDFKDALRSPNLIVMVILPFMFPLIYQNISFGGESMDPRLILSFGLLMNMSLIPIAVMAMMIAEEKEKNTLRTLMLSNVSAGEFLLSKALVVLLLVEIVNLGIYLIVRDSNIALVHYVLITLPASLSVIFFGAVVGLVCKNQMSTGSVSAPIALLFLLPTMLGMMDESIEKFARFLPTFATLELLFGTEEPLFFTAVLIAWIVLGAALFAIVYHRKRLD